MRQSFAPPLLFLLSLFDLMYPFSLSLLLSLSCFHASLFSFFYSFSLFIPHSTYCTDLHLSLFLNLTFFPRFVHFVFFLCKIQPPRITIFPFREIHEILHLAFTWRSGSFSIKATSSYTLYCIKFNLLQFFVVFIFNSDETRWEL